MSRVAVGRLTGVFGIRGEIKCRPASSDVTFVPGERYALGPDPDAKQVVCAGARRHHDRLLLAFEDIANPEDARAFVGLELYAERANVELGRDEYLDADLVGLRLVDESGREVARVIGVRHFPAQDCLVVEPGRALVPLVKAFVRAIDLGAGTIVVDLPDGLLTLGG